MARSLGIVVPAYDPDRRRLVDYLEALAALDPAELRVELDAASEDVRSALAELPATVHAVPHRRGKGAAVTAGFEALETDVYAFVDADGSTPVESLRDVVAPVREGAVDLAVGSRRHPEAVVHDSQSRVRERAGDAYAWIARQLLPIALYDYQCGAKAVDAAAWTRVRDDIYEPGFGWDLEFVAAAARRGCSVAEVPIEWADRPGSTVDLVGSAPSLLRGLVRGRRGRPSDPGQRRSLPDRLTERE